MSQDPMYLLVVKHTEEVESNLRGRAIGLWICRATDRVDGQILEVGFPCSQPGRLMRFFGELPGLGIHECKLAGWTRYFPPNEAPAVFQDFLDRQERENQAWLNSIRDRQK